MKISICITVFNEEKTIAGLLNSLVTQTKKPDEIVIVDGGSGDKTVEIIRHYQKKNGSIKLLVQKCTRAEGRNLGVELARNDIIVITDAGCIADKNWLKRITAPFAVSDIDIVAGFYRMVGDTQFQKAASVFLGVSPSKFDINFLPSTRSIAFRKKVWEKIGGFPESKENSAEDTYFNYKALKLGVKYSRVKNAIVEWGMPDSVSNFQLKIYNYAKWDARSKVWLFPGKGIASHNIHSLLIFIRYFVGCSILILGFVYSQLWLYGFIVISLYLFWAFRKTKSLWGITLQIVSDFAVMAGFLNGLLGVKLGRDRRHLR